MGSLLATKIDRWPSIKVTTLPTPVKKASLSSLIRSFNYLVCIDHMYLEESFVLHVMDAATRYSASLTVPTSSMDFAITSFDYLWMSSFWATDTFLADLAFDSEQLKSYMQNIGCELRLIPARRHNKRILESKHRIIRYIYLHLQHARNCQDYALSDSSSYRSVEWSPRRLFVVLYTT